MKEIIRNNNDCSVVEEVDEKEVVDISTSKYFEKYMYEFPFKYFWKRFYRLPNNLCIDFELKTRKQYENNLWTGYPAYTKEELCHFLSDKVVKLLDIQSMTATNLAKLVLHINRPELVVTCNYT